MTDQLDAALRALASDVAFPPTPDLGAGVQRRLRERPSGWRAAWPRPLVVAFLVVLLALAAAAAAVLTIPGLRLGFGSALPSPEVPDQPLAIRLSLGEPVSTESVDVGVPERLGPPIEAYVIGDDAVVSLVYPAGDALPELGSSDIGLLVQVIDGALDRERVEKLAFRDGVTLVEVDVDGEPGYWIEGRRHLIRYLDPAGDASFQATRLAGDTLVWERDGVLYRIESGLGRLATVEIAETIPR